MDKAKLDPDTLNTAAIAINQMSAKVEQTNHFIGSMDRNLRMVTKARNVAGGRRKRNAARDKKRKTASASRKRNRS